MFRRLLFDSQSEVKVISTAKQPAVSYDDELSIQKAICKDTLRTPFRKIWNFHWITFKLRRGRFLPCESK